MVESREMMELVMPAEWRDSVARHRERVSGWVADRRRRAGVSVRHPVYDFLFEYYSFRGAELLRWSPGIGVLLRGAASNSFPGAEYLSAVPAGLMLSPDHFPRHRVGYLEWAIRYLELTGARAPAFRCFGMHEWAFIAGGEQRHVQTPLRLPRSTIAAVVHEIGLRCTHYDAYRFFTPPVAKSNRWPLRRDATPAYDQAGCVHVSMDLYRFAYKIAPFSSSAVLGDAFELAAAARAIDMRASPYDLAAFGLEPITIETEAGRESYAEAQRGLAERAIPVRRRLICEYRRLRNLLLSEGPAPRFRERIETADPPSGCDCNY